MRATFRPIGAGLAASAAIALFTASATPADAAPAAAPVRQAACPGNLLQNPGFEGDSRKTESEGTSLSSAVSNGWSPWFVRGDATWNREPEFKVEQTRIGGDPARVHSGANSMKWFTTWGTHTSGIYQRVSAQPGTSYTFSIFAQSQSGEADIFDEARRTWGSDPLKPGNYDVRVGIDPTGAVPPIGSAPPATVVWSPPIRTVDTWLNLAVSAVARSSTITVYTLGTAEFPVKHNNSFWDDGCLRVGSFAPAGGVIGVPDTATTAAVVAPDATGGVTAPAAAAASEVAPAAPAPSPHSGRIEGDPAGRSAELTFTVQRGVTQRVTVEGAIGAPKSWNGAGFNVWGPNGRLAHAALGHGESTAEFTPAFDGPVTVQIYNYLPGQILGYRVVTMGPSSAPVAQ